MIVADASAIIQACLSEVELGQLAAHGMIAPPLMWSEATSVLHELKWRRVISGALADAAFARLQAAPVKQRRPPRLREEAWQLADPLGWAKTYDAEYVALARLSKCRLLTTDAKLAAAAHPYVVVIGPSEL